MRVLLTNPEVDALTTYLAAWTKYTLKNCKQNTNKYFQLKRENVTRKKFESFITKRSIDLVLLNGHGEADKVYGNNDIILDINNSKLLKGKVVHALSCESAKVLGMDAMQNGAKAYVGYKEDFIAFLDNTKRISKPLEDKTASLFLKPAFTAPSALLKGYSAEEAVKMAKKSYNKSINEAINSDIQSDNDQFVVWLLWDRDNLVSCEK